MSEDKAKQMADVDRDVEGLTRNMPGHFGRKSGGLVRLLFVGGLGFNLVWLVVAPVAGMFQEHWFVRPDSLRELALQYYGERRPERFIGITLYDLYQPHKLVLSLELVSDLFSPNLETWQEIGLRGGMMDVEIVDDTSALVGELPDGVVVTYTVGPYAREVSFVIPETGRAPWDAVVAVRSGARIVFVPLPVVED